MALDPASTPPAAVSKCTVFGWVKDESDSPVVGATVTIELLEPKGTAYFVNVTNGQYIRPSKKTATTNAAGYFEVAIISSAKLTPTGAKYRIKVVNAEGLLAYNKSVTIPDLTSVNLKDLT